MPRVERSLFLAAGLALAIVGSASCKRQETPPPPPPITASGEPKPQPDFQATAQQPAGVKLPEAQKPSAKAETTPQKIPEREPILFTSADNGYQLYYPKGWEAHARWEGTNADMFLNREAKNFTTELHLDAIFLIRITEVNAQKLAAENIFEESKKYLERQRRNREVKRNALPFNAESGVVLETQILEGSSAAYEIRYYLFKKGLWVYRFKLKADPAMMPQEAKTVEEMLSTLELTQKPQLAEVPTKAPPPPRTAEAQKPASVERVTIRLKPEELSRALLTTPLENNELPAGFTSKGKSAGTLDKTAEKLGAIDQVNVLVIEADPRFLGMPSGGISYTIFRDAAGAKDAYNMYAKRSDSRTISTSPYPTAFLIEQSPFAKVNLCVVLVENTFIAATLTSIDQTPREEKTVALAQAGVKHLQKVGR